MRNNVYPTKDNLEASFLEEIYERYQLYVYKLAWQKCVRSCDVEDVVQNTWESLWRKHEVLLDLPVHKQVSYIAVTLTNVIRMDARKKKLDTCALECISNLAYDGTALLEHLMERRIKIAEFQEVWSTVNPAMREVLERKYILEQTDTEIASSMQIKPSSFRMYLTRARRYVMKSLQKGDQAPL